MYFKVENFIKNCDESLISFDVLKKNFKCLDEKELKKILFLLEKNNKIVISDKGITWIESNIILKKLISEGLEL